MKVINIDKSDWAAGLAKLGPAYQLFGPVKEKSFHNFHPLAEGQLPDMTCQNTRLSAKGIIFPQSEDMLTYSLDPTDADHHVMKEVPANDAAKAIIGIRPCDAKAFELVRLNFDTEDYKDPYWLNAYNNTTFVGLACDAPCSSCFCTSAGCGPYHEAGLDVLLVDNDGGYLAKVLTDKGQALVEAAGWTRAAEGEDDIDQRRQAAEAKIASGVATDNLRQADTLALHGADFWDDVAFACLNCGTCTYSCPTCWCFDIQDEVHGRHGKRMRNWESCMFPIFTVHTTGHNPRDTKTQRVRQRFMHKLKYFVDKYDQGIMCVGCGRCVRQCPVNIDIRKVCDLMNGHAAEKACAAQG